MKKKYRVVRDCCTSGNCVNTCWDKTPYGVCVRVVQCDGIENIKRAEQVVRGWASYNAKMEVE